MSEEHSGESDEERFAEIVAQLRAEGHWPDPNRPEDPPPAAEAADRRSGSSPAQPPEPADQGDDDSAAEPAATNSPWPHRDPLAGLPSQWRAPTTNSESILDANDDYEPPPPAPLPTGDLSFWGALGALVGGPVWLLYLVFVDRYARTIWWVLACLLLVAGFVLLVLRQPRRRDDDWDDDVDGAQL